MVIYKQILVLFLSYNLRQALNLPIQVTFFEELPVSFLPWRRSNQVQYTLIVSFVHISSAHGVQFFSYLLVQLFVCALSLVS